MRHVMQPLNSFSIKRYRQQQLIPPDGGRDVAKASPCISFKDRRFSQPKFPS